MYQLYESPAGFAADRERLKRLRALLVTDKLDGLLVPRGDEFMGEYVPASRERLAWLTGFTGSAGLAVVLAARAALFVDGRYTLQAAEQVVADDFEIVKIPQVRPGDWLEQAYDEAGAGQEGAPGWRIGYDARLHPERQIEALERKFKTRQLVLVDTGDNLIDRLWQDRPADPVAAIELHGPEYAGLAAADKINAIKQRLAEAGQHGCVLTQTDSIAWLFNIRGHDVPHTPVALCFAIVYADRQPMLFIDPAKVPEAVGAALGQIITIAPMTQLGAELAALGERKARVRLDPATASRWFFERLRAAGAVICAGDDPCVVPKAIKNEVEQAGARRAHRRDAVAMCRFLAWLDGRIQAVAPGTSEASVAEPGTPIGVTEIAAARMLEEMRRATGELQDISFDTISGAGPNGAIVHYRVTTDTDRDVRMGELFLLDSGGQYKDGTTDITRTMAIGTPTAGMRRHYTLVLKGHIAISRARFPQGIRGCDLDVLARHALWQAGLDYEHGTGHGVGSYLSVHEGPQGLSRRAMAELHPGMILSNEPGYYRTGEYGIRIENLILVSPAASVEGGEQAMLGFEPLTLVPYDRALIDCALLTADERRWIDDYHQQVLKTVAPLLSAEDRQTHDWLTRATAPLACKPVAAING